MKCSSQWRGKHGHSRKADAILVIIVNYSERNPTTEQSLFSHLQSVWNA